MISNVSTESLASKTIPSDVETVNPPPFSPSEVTRVRYDIEDGHKYGRWFAMVGDAQSKGCQPLESVSSKWVRENFSNEFVDLCRATPRKYVFVPVGRSSSTCALSVVNHEGRPPVAYQQTMDRAGKTGCVAYGLSSALHYIGATDKWGNQISHSVMKFHNPKFLGNRMTSYKMPLCKLGWGCTTMTSFDPLKNVSPMPTVMQLLTSSGCCAHAVTLVGNWIFDSNKTHAVYLTKEGLDSVCLDTDKFVKSKYAFRLVPFRDVKEHMDLLIDIDVPASKKRRM